jgi:uncharacterized membrane protein YuzA (DUF378 family)
MKYLNFITLILVIIGGINWGLYAFGGNIVHVTLSGVPEIENIVYILVGISALYQVKSLFSIFSSK